MATLMQYACENVLDVAEIPVICPPIKCTTTWIYRMHVTVGVIEESTKRATISAREHD